MFTDRSINRRQFIKRTLLGLGGVFFMGSAASYAYMVEPFWLEVSKKTLYLPKIPLAFQSCKVLHFTDIHYQHPVTKKDLAKVMEQINRLKPDIICFTGDLADHSATPIKELIPLLSDLKAPMGKFAIMGNHDGRHLDLSRVWRESGFVYLQNEHRIIRYKGDQLAMAGIDYLPQSLTSPRAIRRLVRQALDGIEPETCTVMLSHYPDYADEIKHFPVDLQLSGHSHGGQVKAPLIGPIVSVNGAMKYVEGLYQWQDRQMQLYVDRGIGCSILPIRFNCRPQMTLLELKGLG